MIYIPTFTVSENQQREAMKFRGEHSVSCPKMSTELRAIFELNEESTPTSSYKYSFVLSGVGNYVYISCCYCKKEVQLHLSKDEMDLL
jgi:hypothetical protein